MQLVIVQRLLFKLLRHTGREDLEVVGSKRRGEVLGEHRLQGLTNYLRLGYVKELLKLAVD